VSTLSHEARAMVAAAKGEIVPSPMDRSRVTHALRDRMGAADLPVPTPALSTPGVAAGRVLKLLVVVGALGVVGALSGVAYVRSHHAHTEAPPQTTIVAQPVPDPLQPSTPATARVGSRTRSVTGRERQPRQDRTATACQQIISRYAGRRGTNTVSRRKRTSQWKAGIGSEGTR